MSTAYIMESPLEGTRLERKTDALKAMAQLKLAGLRSGMTALDVGCGTGAVTRVMAEMVGAGSVTGLDQSGDRITEAIRLAGSASNIHFRDGQIQCLPFADETCDFTWSRFLFEYLPEPLPALHEMRRVTRRGGKVAAVDLDGQIIQFHPLPEDIGRDVDECLRLLAKTGFDPYVGRKLPLFFRQAGFKDIQVHVEPYQVYHEGIPSEELGNWKLKLGTIAALLGTLTGEHQRFEKIGENFLRHLMKPDTFYYSNLILVSGTP